MSLIFVILAGAVAILLIYFSITGLEQKRRQMYQQKYREALQRGNTAKIMEAGHTYYTVLLPKQKKHLIDLTIQDDMATYRKVIR